MSTPKPTSQATSSPSTEANDALAQSQDATQAVDALVSEVLETSERLEASLRGEAPSQDLLAQIAADEQLVSQLESEAATEPAQTTEQVIERTDETGGENTASDTTDTSNNQPLDAMDDLLDAIAELRGDAPSDEQTNEALAQQEAATSQNDASLQPVESAETAAPAQATSLLDVDADLSAAFDEAMEQPLPSNEANPEPQVSQIPLSEVRTVVQEPTSDEAMSETTGQASNEVSSLDASLAVDQDVEPSADAQQTAQPVAIDAAMQTAEDAIDVETYVSVEPALQGTNQVQSAELASVQSRDDAVAARPMQQADDPQGNQDTADKSDRADQAFQAQSQPTQVPDVVAQADSIESLDVEIAKVADAQLAEAASALPDASMKHDVVASAEQPKGIDAPAPATITPPAPAAVSAAATPQPLAPIAQQTDNIPVAATATASQTLPDAQTITSQQAIQPATAAIAPSPAPATAASALPIVSPAPSKAAQQATKMKERAKSLSIAARERFGKRVSEMLSRVSTPTANLLAKAHGPLLKKPKSLRDAAGMIALHTFALGVALWFYAAVWRSPYQASAVDTFDFAHAGLPQPDNEPGHDDEHADAKHESKAGSADAGGGHGEAKKDGKPAKPILGDEKKFVVNDEMNTRSKAAKDGKKEAKSGGH